MLRLFEACGLSAPLSSGSQALLLCIFLVACLIEALVISSTTAHYMDAHNKLAILLLAVLQFRVVAFLSHSAGTRW